MAWPISEMSELTQKFQCKLCASWKDVATEHPHQHFKGLCLTCVKNMRNKAINHTRRMRKNHPNVSGTQIRNLTASDWLDVLRQHDFCCAFCGVSSSPKCQLTLDHIYPLNLGGFNRSFNIQPLCARCHEIKDAHPTILPWKLNHIKQEQVRRTKTRRSRNRDFKLFKKMGYMPSEDFFAKAKLDYDRDREFVFYENLHEYLIERVLMYWLDSKMKERFESDDRTFCKAA